MLRASGKGNGTDMKNKKQSGSTGCSSDVIRAALVHVTAIVSCHLTAIWKALPGHGLFIHRD